MTRLKLVDQNHDAQDDLERSPLASDPVAAEMIKGLLEAAKKLDRYGGGGWELVGDARATLDLKALGAICDKVQAKLAKARREWLRRWRIHIVVSVVSASLLALIGFIFFTSENESIGQILWIALVIAGAWATVMAADPDQL